jgi:hypothetical protein
MTTPKLVGRPSDVGVGYSDKSEMEDEEDIEFAIGRLLVKCSMIDGAKVQRCIPGLSEYLLGMSRGGESLPQQVEV